MNGALAPSQRPMVQPLRTRLALIDATRAAEERRLAGALARLSLGDGGEALRPRLRIEPATDAGPPLWMHFACGGGRLAVAPEIVAGRPAQWVTEETSPRLPQAIAALAGVEFVLQALERQSGLELAPVGLGGAAGRRFELELRRADGSPQTRLWLAFDAGAADAWPRRVQAPVLFPVGLDDVRLRCAITLEGPSPRRRELAMLEAGDIVTLPGQGPWPATARAPGGGPRLCGALDIARRRFVLQRLKVAPMDDIQAPVRPAAPAPRFPDTSPLEPPAGRAEGAPPSTLLQDLPVTLRLVVGELSLAIGELAGLAPGAVLEIASPREDLAVGLFAETAQIAAGRLVALGDGFGVLIETVAGG